MNHDRPSMTAAVVAATLLLLREDAELGRLVDPRSLHAVELAVRETLPGAAWALDRLPWPVLSRLAMGVERAISPGFVSHYALRKHAIRAHLQRAVAEGHDQVVLVGAGFDMLSASVPETAKVFEVDFESTQAAKRRALEGARAREVTFVPADLSRTRLGDALRRAEGFDPRRDTVFVAEGLLMYLERPAVEGIFADMPALGDRVRAILSVVTPDRTGRVRLHSQRGVVDLCMRLLGEPFIWGASPTRLEEVLAGHDLRVDDVCATTEYGAPLVSARRRPPPTGEVIVLASSTRPRSTAARPRPRTVDPGLVA